MSDDIDKYMISWLNWRYDQCYEHYETKEAAMAAVEEYRVHYPWNTYLVSEVFHVQEATEPMPREKPRAWDLKS